MPSYGRNLLPIKPLIGDQGDPRYEHYDTEDALDQATIRQQQWEDRLRRAANRSQLHSGSFEMERTIRNKLGKEPPYRPE